MTGRWEGGETGHASARPVWGEASGLEKRGKLSKGSGLLGRSFPDSRAGEACA